MPEALITPMTWLAYAIIACLGLGCVAAVVVVVRFVRFTLRLRRERMNMLPRPFSRGGK